MAKIREYFSTKDTLTPVETGYQAWEMAGRRIGPLYSQAANDVKESAKLLAQGGDLAAKNISEYDKQLEKLQNAKPARSSGGGSSGADKAARPVQERAAASHVTAAAADEVGRGLLTGRNSDSEKGKGPRIISSDDPSTERNKALAQEPQSFQQLMNRLTSGEPGAGYERTPFKELINSLTGGSTGQADIDPLTGAPIPAPYMYPNTAEPGAAANFESLIRDLTKPKPAPDTSWGIGKFFTSMGDTLGDVARFAYQHTAGAIFGNDTQPGADNPVAQARSSSTGEDIPTIETEPQPGDSNYRFTQSAGSSDSSDNGPAAPEAPDATPPPSAPDTTPPADDSGGIVLRGGR